MTATEITQALECFTGTTKYHAHQLPFDLKLHLTDGCDYIRKECMAYWLFDAILSYQMEETIKTLPFQKWILEQQLDDTWELRGEDGNDQVMVVQGILYSDFPLPSITFFLVDGVVMLPTEY